MVGRSNNKRIDGLRVATGAMEVASFVLFLIMVVLFAKFYTALPDTIEFTDASGNMLSVEVKTIFLVAFWLGFATYGALFLLKRFPRMMPYPVKLNAANIEFQAKFARFALSVLTLLSSVFFIIVIYYIYRNIMAPEEDITTYAVIAVFVLIVACVVGYVLLARHKDKVLSEDSRD